MPRLTLTLASVLVLLTAGCKRSEDATLHETADHAQAAVGHAEEGGHTDEVALAAEAIQKYGVKVDVARPKRLVPTFIVPARVGFNTEAMAHVGSPLPGRVIELKTRLGSEVKVHDPLLVVESPELGAAQSDYLIKRTLAASAAPAVDLAKTSWDRAQNLLESSQGIALTEVQRREAEYKQALASLSAAQAEAVAAENHLHLLGVTQEQVQALTASGEVDPRFTIVAPIAGQVVQREVTLGELVSPDREALLVIADMGTLWVLADVPEARLMETAIGATASVRIGGVDGAQFNGTVAFVSPMVDAATRSAQVRIEVNDRDKVLKPGMFAQAEITAVNRSAPESSPVLAVPEEAVQTVEGETSVFVPVPGEENTFAKRPVTIGRQVGGWVQVLAGLTEGEQYVAGGSFILKAELGKGSAAHEH